MSLNKYPHSSKQWETRITELLRSKSVLSLIRIQIISFEHKYNMRPELVRLNILLRPAFTLDLMRKLNLPAASAVIDPIWIDDIPVICNISGKDTRYIICTHRAIGAKYEL